ncbi:GAD-like domain-containing protein [Pseudomonas sp. Pseu.R1]|uniref:GAD-like domain-containing protein n=1 Tax=Pseudomonas sp. Pseu.R1 TaxID=3379818 RepID=UPI003B94D91B
MDEYFQIFLNDLGALFEHNSVPHSSVKKYRHTLPKQLISHWIKHGWSGYGDGIFWVTDPDEYQKVVCEWLEESKVPSADSYHVVARGAFGDLYLWQEHTGHILKITAFLARYHIRTNVPGSDLDEEIQSFFALMSRESNDFDDMFEKALKKLGPLKSDEIYGFVPAMALGGPGKFEHLQKVKIIEHIAFLSQLSPLTDWGFPDFETIMKLTE